MLQKDVFIYERESVKDALKKLGKSAEKVLLVIDANRNLLGTLTDGDIRRYVLRGKSLQNNIKGIYNIKPTFIKKDDFSIGRVKKMLIEKKIELLPILDAKNKVVSFTTWNEVFSDRQILAAKKVKINTPVVIMSGGKGERLEPFSKIFPKALIPIGDKPIIEVIIEEFKKQGIRTYYLTLNYKGEMIESYFNNIVKDYQIEYMREGGFYGTAGSIRLLKKKIGKTFIVSNCDVIVKADFEEVLHIHKEEKASLTVLSSIQHHKIPYGVIEFKQGGEVIGISEKPEYTFTVNAGVYVLNRECLKFIPEKKYFDMTDLISSLIKNKKKVITYPVNENDYIDIGQWEEYKKAIEKLQVFR